MSIIVDTVRIQAMFQAGLAQESVSGGFMVVGAARAEGGDPSSGRHAVFVNNGTQEETK